MAQCVGEGAGGVFERGRAMLGRRDREKKIKM